MKRSAWQPSLRRKIVLGYLMIAVLMLGASMFTFERLRVLEDKVYLGERAAELFDTTLEIRRFERNYFLHRQAADYQENARYVARTRELLELNKAAFEALEAPQQLVAFRELLQIYPQRMAAYAAATGPAQVDVLERRVRETGQQIVAIAETVSSAEHRVVRSSMASARTILVSGIGLIAVLIIVLGQALSRSVVLPLKEMQASVDAISRGAREKLSPPSRDREIVSIITAFNHMLRELEIRHKHLMRSEKLASMGTMLSGVAHELNNPLSNISTSCQILQEDVESMDPATREKFLTQIDSQTTRAKNIVRSLLDFSSDRPDRPETVALAALMEQTLSFIRGEIPVDTAIQVDIPANLALTADRQRLQQVLLNLIRNAVEAAGERGHVAVSARRHRVTEDEAGDAMQGSGCNVTGDVIDIAVHDDGPGIAGDVLPRIFDPFYTTKDVGEGMGLGLFVAFEIVEEHGGCISATSLPGQGSTFTLRLPARGGAAK